MFEPIFEVDEGAVIKVVGVGGGGGNAVNHMVALHTELQQKLSQLDRSMLPEFSNASGSVDFYVVNTDAQALRSSKVANTVQIGARLTKGLGAGANPNIGQQAAEEDEDAIRQMLEGADMVFIAAGMGGGTGTGAAPVIARIAKDLGAVTVAVVTKPFKFEMGKRMRYAEQGINALSNHVDSLLVIPNDKLKTLGKNITMINAFAAANDILSNSVRGISEMITSPGLINVDFMDVKTVMTERGRAMMGTGIGVGEAGSGRAEEATKQAITNTLLENIDLAGARGVLVNVASGLNTFLDEFEAVGQVVEEFAHPDATVVVGSSLLPELEDEIRVTIVATGIGVDIEEEKVQAAPKVQPRNEGYPYPPRREENFEQNNLSKESVYEQRNNQYERGAYDNRQPEETHSAPEPRKPSTVNPFDVPSWLRKNSNNN